MVSLKPDALDDVILLQLSHSSSSATMNAVRVVGEARIRVCDVRGICASSGAQYDEWEKEEEEEDEGETSGRLSSSSAASGGAALGVHSDADDVRLSMPMGQLSMPVAHALSSLAPPAPYTLHHALSTLRQCTLHPAPAPALYSVRLPAWHCSPLHPASCLALRCDWHYANLSSHGTARRWQVARSIATWLTPRRRTHSAVMRMKRAESNMLASLHPQASALERRATRSSIALGGGRRTALDFVHPEGGPRFERALTVENTSVAGPSPNLGGSREHWAAMRLQVRLRTSAMPCCSPACYHARQLSFAAVFCSPSNSFLHRRIRIAYYTPTPAIQMAMYRFILTSKLPMSLLAVMRITLERATGLPNLDVNGTSDPYCVLTIENRHALMPLLPLRLCPIAADSV